ncbi:hypothetical protein BDM02DRAFT_3133459 [Thelephora ganbajun]|uniref:Uncharacterized protein n=1 Tax=Thelephora ganbajun TaxID=370292 RepID=A0ACB6YWW8_THEGA|nr:hypothetical protein BDM02DRAFT_3133459 [Thelephora ganbajun]
MLSCGGSQKGCCLLGSVGCGCAATLPETLIGGSTLPSRVNRDGEQKELTLSSYRLVLGEIANNPGLKVDFKILPYSGVSRDPPFSIVCVLGFTSTNNTEGNHPAWWHISGTPAEPPPLTTVPSIEMGKSKRDKTRKYHMEQYRLAWCITYVLLLPELDLTHHGAALGSDRRGGRYAGPCAIRAHREANHQTVDGGDPRLAPDQWMVWLPMVRAQGRKREHNDAAERLRNDIEGPTSFQAYLGMLSSTQTASGQSQEGSTRELSPSRFMPSEPRQVTFSTEVTLFPATDDQEIKMDIINTTPTRRSWNAMLRDQGSKKTKRRHRSSNGNCWVETLSSSGSSGPLSFVHVDVGNTIGGFQSKVHVCAGGASVPVQLSTKTSMMPSPLNQAWQKRSKVPVRAVNLGS